MTCSKRCCLTRGAVAPKRMPIRQGVPDLRQRLVTLSADQSCISFVLMNDEKGRICCEVAGEVGARRPCPSSDAIWRPGVREVSMDGDDSPRSRHLRARP